MSDQKIHGALITAMRAVQAVSKSKRSGTDGGPQYAFRGIDDLYNELHDVLAAAGIFNHAEILSRELVEITRENKPSMFESRLHVRWHFSAEDGSFITHDTIGIGRDMQDKAANKAMAMAHKYALIQVLMVPTADAKDSEDVRHDSREQEARAKAGAPKVPASSAQTPAQGNTPPVSDTKKQVDDLIAEMERSANVDVLEAVSAKIRPLQNSFAAPEVLRLQKTYRFMRAKLNGGKP